MPDLDLALHAPAQPGQPAIRSLDDAYLKVVINAAGLGLFDGPTPSMTSSSDADERAQSPELFAPAAHFAGPTPEVDQAPVTPRHDTPRAEQPIMPGVVAVASSPQKLRRSPRLANASLPRYTAETTSAKISVRRKRTCKGTAAATAKKGRSLSHLAKSHL